MPSLELAWLMAQIQASQQTNPLMNRAGERLVYIGVSLMAIAISIVLGFFNRRLDIAIIVSLLLSAVIIGLLLIP